jgi:hypothetical protein
MSNKMLPQKDLHKILIQWINLQDKPGKKKWNVFPCKYFASILQKK